VIVGACSSPVPVNMCATIATQVAWPAVAQDERRQASILAFDLEGTEMLPVDWRLKYAMLLGSAG